VCTELNPLDRKGNYSATSNNTKLVHWPLMGGLLHLVQRRRAWAGCGPVQSPARCTICNSPPINGQCTNHGIAIWWLLLCGFNVAIKGLMPHADGSRPMYVGICVYDRTLITVRTLQIKWLKTFRPNLVGSHYLATHTSPFILEVKNGWNIFALFFRNKPDPWPVGGCKQIL